MWNNEQSNNDSFAKLYYSRTEGGYHNRLETIRQTLMHIELMKLNNNNNYCCYYNTLKIELELAYYYVILFYYDIIIII